MLTSGCGKRRQLPRTNDNSGCGTAHVTTTSVLYRSLSTHLTLRYAEIEHCQVQQP